MLDASSWWSSHISEFPALNGLQCTPLNFPALPETELKYTAILWSLTINTLWDAILNNMSDRGASAPNSWQKPRVRQIPFLTEYKYQILFGFQNSLNTKYQILFGIDKIRVLNTEYYSLSRISLYQIQMVLFGLTILILNTKYRIVYKILEKKMKLK